MTKTKEAILKKLFPNYKNLESYSDYELKLVMDNCPEYPEFLENSIIKEVQWCIVRTLFGKIINNWADFFLENEDKVMDCCFESTFITRNCENNSYCVSKEIIINICKDLLCEVDYSINEDVDFRDIISDLNKYYPIKFCEV